MSRFDVVAVSVAAFMLPIAVAFEVYLFLTWPTPKPACPVEKSKG